MSKLQETALEATKAIALELHKQYVAPQQEVVIDTLMKIIEMAHKPTTNKDATEQLEYWNTPFRVLVAALFPNVWSTMSAPYIPKHIPTQQNILEAKTLQAAETILLDTFRVKIYIALLQSPTQAIRTSHSTYVLQLKEQAKQLASLETFYVANLSEVSLFSNPESVRKFSSVADDTIDTVSITYRLLGDGFEQLHSEAISAKVDILMEELKGRERAVSKEEESEEN
jgi:hypothetical protein